MSDAIPVGSVWREKPTNRLIRVTAFRDVPWWVYIDAAGFPEPDGPDHPNWYDHCCDFFDFIVWGRFERVS